MLEGNVFVFIWILLRHESKHFGGKNLPPAAISFPSGENQT
jgi:hypothetical protein